MPEQVEGWDAADAVACARCAIHGRAGPGGARGNALIRWQARWCPTPGTAGNGPRPLAGWPHGRRLPTRPTASGNPRRTRARRLLADARACSTSLGTLRVISLEGLIAFKLQGLVNDPRRTQDLEDIRALLRANRDLVDLEEVRSYFRSTVRRCSMKSSRPYPEPAQSSGERTVILFPDGGVASAPDAERDPFAALDDLMTVVEALCPSWPPREPFGPMRRLRL